MFFFFNDTATTEIYTLSLHDALPISPIARAWRLFVRRSRETGRRGRSVRERPTVQPPLRRSPTGRIDRKSTRLNSSHANISYAVFCLKKKKNSKMTQCIEPRLTYVF